MSRNYRAWQLKGFRRKSEVFYTVQGADDFARLRSGGAPWPAAANKAHLGEGVYAWGSRFEAAAYLDLEIMLKRDPTAAIRSFRVGKGALQRFRSLRVDSLADPEAWMTRYSRLWGGVPDHGLQYIQRGTHMGPEHYFSSSVFGDLRF